MSLGKKDGNDIITTKWIVKSKDKRKKVMKFCKRKGLKVCSCKGEHIKVIGNTKTFNKVLKTEIHNFKHENKIHHNIISKIKMPKYVENIFGLDTKSKFTPYFYVKEKTEGDGTFTPIELASLYNFPNATGVGQRIAIVELGGGYFPSDIQKYFDMLKIKTPPKITDVSVGGAKNDPTDQSGANLEVILDIEIIAAIVPEADIRVYFAENSDLGFYSSIDQAINDNCSIISISWGGPEASWDASFLNSYNKLFQKAVNKNITILTAAGDQGSSDGIAGINVDFPGSSPYALSCGGTNLQAANNVIVNETVWNVDPTQSATGGGISKVFTMPDYQTGLKIVSNNKRMVPDISANADPNTGYIVYGEGSTMVVGGTSAVSPLWSGLLARINQINKKNVGFIQPLIYKSQGAACRDITVGNNGAYSASPGYDLCTGYGSPDGEKLLSLFK